MPGALADEVDAVVAERPARGLEIVDPLDDAVAGEIDAVVVSRVCAVAEGVAVGAEGLLAEVVGRPLQRGRDLGAVEPDRAVDAAIADEDDVAVVREPARPFELHVGPAGATLEPEERLRGVVREGADAGDRQRDQPRLRVGPVLRHDERAAVGRVAALLRGVVAVLEDQVAGLRTVRHRDRIRAGREAKVGETGDEDADQHEGDDSCGREGS